MTASNPPRHDALSIAGMIVVGMAAAVLSFSTWVQLAESVGFTESWTASWTAHDVRLTVRIAWLLPLAVDCYTLTVIRVWLNSPPESQVVRYAKANAIGAIALTVTAQAVYHAFAAAGWQQADLWWFAIVIGGIPPLLLGLVMDLFTRMIHERRSDATRSTDAAAVSIQIQGAASSPNPASTDEAALEPHRVSRRSGTARRSTPQAESGVHRIDNEDTLMAYVYPIVESWVAEHGEPPGQHTMRNALAELQPAIRIGTRRAGRLIDRAVREPRTSPDDKEQAA